MTAIGCGIENKTAGYIPEFGDKKASDTALSAGADGDSWGFADFLDVINPLQHLPVVGALYRRLTGDEIRPEAKIMGGALFGGGIGAAVAMADAAFQQANGKDVGGMLLASVMGEKEKTPASAPAAPAPETLMLAQESPQPAAREQVAFKMMQALDSYGAMKRPAGSI